MIELHDGPEPEIAHAPEVPADPRTAAWHHYRTQALGAVCGSQIILEGLRGLLDGSGAGGLDEFAQHITALEFLYRELGSAAQGLVAVDSTSGIA